MTQHEYEQRVEKGEKLATLDNIIFDMRSYIDEHPAGAFVMNACIGKDVGRYLNGSYIIEKNGTCQKPHLHTNYALGIVKKLAIAQLKPSDYIKASQGKTVSKEYQEQWVVSKAHVRNSNTSTYDFSNENFLVKRFFGGVSETGKHFIITSRDTGVGRYYTICNYYSDLFYEKYNDWSKQVLSGATSYSGAFQLSDVELECNSLPMTIKVYDFPKALSKYIESRKGHYQVNGPLGNGL